MNQEPISRRGFLTGAVAIVAVAVAPAGLLRLVGGTQVGATSGAVARLVGLFDDPNAVEPLGGAYLEGRSDRPDQQRILTELLPPSTTEQMVVDLTDDELRDLLHRWSSDDLAAGRMEQVGGWLLSHTEVRLAALVVGRA